MRRRDPSCTTRFAHSGKGHWVTSQLPPGRLVVVAGRFIGIGKDLERQYKGSLHNSSFTGVRDSGDSVSNFEAI